MRRRYPPKMMRVAHGRPRLATWLAASAVGWSLVLIAGAFTFPAYSGDTGTSVVRPATSSAPATTTDTFVHTSSTLVAQNGTWVLIPVAVPALLVAVAWVGLRRGRKGRRIAAAAAGLLAAFNLLALFSIGLFVIPATALIFLALLATPAIGGAALSGASAPAHR
jgi:hypothetical protein